MRVRLLAIAALLAASLPASADDSGKAGTLMNVGGIVLAGGHPVDDALVIAFGLSTPRDERASTDVAGEFALAPLPVGVYRVIAVKRGFAPSLAMIVPGRSQQRLAIRLRREAALTAAEREDVWEVRRALPRDILREIETALARPVEEEPETRAALAGNLSSLQGFDSVANARTADRTSLALRGGMGAWNVGIAGHRRAIDTSDSALSSVAEASDLEFELRGPRGGSYRFASSASSWPQQLPGRPETELQNHSIAWVGRETRVTLRYVERENVFEGESGPVGALELEGNRTLYRSERAGIDLQLRVADERLAASPAEGGRESAWAEVLTTGEFVPARSLSVGYGLLTRAGRYGGVEYVPQAAVSTGVLRVARITVSGSTKLASDGSPVEVAPVVTEMGRMSSGEARYRYAVAISRELGRSGSVTASASASEADNTAYLFFDDRFEEFWDGLYVASGDETRALGLAATTTIARVTLGFDGSTGSIEREGDTAEGHREYLVAAVRAAHDGTGTSIDVAYRRIGQPLADDERIYHDVERLSVVLAQSLRLPVDLRLMLGVAVTRERDAGGDLAVQRDARRLVGGVAFSF